MNGSSVNNVSCLRCLIFEEWIQCEQCIQCEQYLGTPPPGLGASDIASLWSISRGQGVDRTERTVITCTCPSCALAGGSACQMGC